MIAYLDGVLAVRATDHAIVDVGGMGYRVACSTTTLGRLPREGVRCKLFTHTHVREDALALFGFATQSEQEMFEALISVSGVGPKVALAVCSTFTPDSFRRAVATDDVGTISSVPGIGRKTAQRTILELKEKLSLPDLAVVGTGSDSLVQARSALENLGYSPTEVRVALSEIASENTEDVQSVIKSALKVLA
jgi:Holliday junction DNA helicase RuvA